MELPKIHHHYYQSEGIDMQKVKDNAVSRGKWNKENSIIHRHKFSERCDQNIVESGNVGCLLVRADGKNA